MPLKKIAGRLERNEERRLQAIARRKAIDIYGKTAVIGKDVHHSDGNIKNNAKKNINLLSKKEHAKKHGRTHGKRGSANIIK